MRKLFLARGLLLVLPLLILNGPVWAKSPVEKVSSPVIKPEGGTYTQPVEVKLSTETKEAMIRYTVDGSEPTHESWVYIEPFVLSSSTVVKAKAFKEGLKASKIAVAQFTINRDEECVGITCLPKCGNKICEPTEDPKTCPEDCLREPLCGDGICDPEETSDTCPMDCKPVPISGSFYGRVTEKVSDASEAVRPIEGVRIIAEQAVPSGGGESILPSFFETITNAEGYYKLSVKTTDEVILYRVTAVKEGFISESKIQGIKSGEKLEVNFALERFSAPVCGDGVCEPSEAVDICPQCITEPCPPCYSCPEDCHPLPVCGDGICNLGETHDTCPADCKPIPTMGSFFGQVTENVPGDDTQAVIPIAGASITAEPVIPSNGGGFIILPPSDYETTTNDQGYYKLAVDTNELGTLYRITAHKEGYSSENIIQVIKPEETLEINFTLVRIVPPVCGDGVCEEGEADFCPPCLREPCPLAPCLPGSCPEDCQVPSECGNGICEEGETKENCPEDCGEKVECGNGVCEEGEATDCPTCLQEPCFLIACRQGSCPEDCQIKEPVCGNGICEETEDARICPLDCRYQVKPPDSSSW